MSGSVNKVILVGRLGQAPEVKATKNDTTVVNISVATGKIRKDKFTGEKKETTEWHRVVAFGKLADIIGEHCKKGTHVYIEGELQTRKWLKDGVDRYTTEVVANEMQMLGRRE